MAASCAAVRGRGEDARWRPPEGGTLNRPICSVFELLRIEKCLLATGEQATKRHLAPAIHSYRQLRCYSRSVANLPRTVKCRLRSQTSIRKLPNRPTHKLEERNQGVPPRHGRLGVVAGAGRRHVLSLKSAAKRSGIDATTTATSSRKTVIAVSPIRHRTTDRATPTSSETVVRQSRRSSRREFVT